MAAILIVDEYKRLGELLREELASQVHSVVVAAGPDALDRTLSRMEFDLVILEPFVRGRERWDLLEMVRERLPRGSILVYTGRDGMGGNPRLAMADGFVIKSSRLSDVREAVARLLGRGLPKDDPLCSSHAPLPLPPEGAKRSSRKHGKAARKSRAAERPSSSGGPLMAVLPTPRTEGSPESLCRPLRLRGRASRRFKESDSKPDSDLQKTTPSGTDPASMATPG
jgi:CheY-like chemotaxis protein